MIDDIGKKIRNLRSAANLTQGELAQRAELTDGFISQVERGLTSISIDSLKMILDALNISLSEFFKEVKHDPIVFTEEDQIEFDDGGDGSLLLLVPGATNRKMEPALLKIDPGKSSSLYKPYNGDFFGYLIQGRVQLAYGKEVLKVSAGSSIYFTADREHRITNPFRRKAVMLIITAPPNF